MKTLITFLFVVALVIPAISNSQLPTCCTTDDTELHNGVDSGKVEDAAETAVQRNITASMVGTWESTVYPFAIKNGKKKARKEGAFLQYHFQADGNYTIEYGDDDDRFQETGYWSISSNGKKIVLNAADSNKKQTIMIKYLELDELVLEHAEVERVKSFSPGDKSVFFHKA